MKAWAVIGASYGDESKGKHVDYLCHKHSADLVVRFNGGAQAGHTVVAPDGRRHVFHHFGSGTLLGVPTYLSRFFVCNPVLFNEERKALLEYKPRVLVDEQCLVTTPFDMVVNQIVEKHRGANRHGSCGVGFNQTITRNELLPLTVWHLHWLTDAILRQRLIDIASYSALTLESAGVAPSQIQEFRETWVSDNILEQFMRDRDAFCEAVVATRKPSAAQCIVFEGAQGLRLDQDDVENFPHVTRSSTGAKNAAALAQEWGVSEFAAVYCTRTYVTRHGTGPLPDEVVGDFPFADNTNVPHDFQGRLRYAPLTDESILSLVRRCAEDARRHAVLMRLAVSHCDQVPIPDLLLKYAHYLSSGPTRTHIEHIEERYRE